MSYASLYIKPIDNNRSSLIKINYGLHADIKPSEFESPDIRFYLHSQSRMILAETNQIRLSEIGEETLQNVLYFRRQLEQVKM